MANLTLVLALTLFGADGSGPVTSEWLRGELMPEALLSDPDALFFGIQDENAERAKKALSRFVDEGLRVEQGDEGLSLTARALLQRDLWGAFDHTDGRSSRHLKSLLASAIKKLALSKSQISSLPGVGANDAVPDGLLEAEGAWVAVRTLDWGDSRPLASAHAESSKGRSAFSVHFSLPEGREATLAYLQTLREFPNPLIMAGEPRVMTLNPAIPQLPVGSSVALVRRALLVDDQLEPVVSPLVESIEIRTFRRIEFSPSPAPGGGFSNCQEVALFAMDRPGLLGSGPLLRQVLPGEIVTNVFRERYHGGSDRIDFLQQCASCHAAAGILSVNTWKDDDLGCPSDGLEAERFRLPRRLVEDTDGWSDHLAVFNKKRTASYGELRTLW